MQRVVLMLMFAAGVSAHDIAQGSYQVITVCVNPGSHVTPFYMARATVSELLKDAGVQVDWQNGDCTTPNAIRITVSDDKPAEVNPGALGLAMPYEGTHVEIYFDRVRNSCRPSDVPVFLGHVMAHEIVHILEGVARHSPTGLMKSRWRDKDYVQIQHGGLRLSKWDVSLIEMGLAKHSLASARK
jgi:hypothetical protein